tara:strand:- start:631 stop:771 length:141 start_codon:yes stop_codon:yes gene_type:complete
MGRRIIKQHKLASAQATQRTHNNKNTAGAEKKRNSKTDVVIINISL